MARTTDFRVSMVLPGGCVAYLEAEMLVDFSRQRLQSRTVTWTSATSPTLELSTTRVTYLPS